MTLQTFILVLVSVSISATAQTVLKLGVSKAKILPEASIIEKLLAFFMQPYVLLGFALYGTGALMWLFALRSLPVSLAYPFVSMAFIMVLLSGVFVLGESLTLPKMLGTGLIIAGLITLGRA